MDYNELDKMIIEKKIHIKRNIKKYPFVSTLNKEKSLEIIEILKGILERYELFSGVEFYNLNTLDEYIINEFKEKGIIDGKNQNDGIYSALFIWSNFYILVNNEDHIEIIIVDRDKTFDEMYVELSKVEDIFEQELVFEFDEKYGYLTTSPMDIGTAMRCEIIFHMPTIVMSGGTNKIFQAVEQVGMTLGDFYKRENSRNYRFALKNVYTLGISEYDIMGSLKSVVYQILSKEFELRNKFLSEKKTNIEDRVYRALGILSNCRIIGYTEAYEYIDDIRLGIESGIIDYDSNRLDNLVNCIGNYTIFNNSDAKRLEEIDIKRANLIRKELEAR